MNVPEEELAGDRGQSRGLGGWPVAGLVLAVAFAVAAVSYESTAASVWRMWEQGGSYGHGLLVIPISLIIIWRERGTLALLQPRPSLSAVWLGLAVAGVWWIGDVAHVQAIEQLAFFAMPLAAVAIVGGWRVGYLLAFALLYPLVAIPAWDALVPPLRDLTTDASVRILRLLQVPVFVEGPFLTIPYGRFEIAEVCAGLRYFLAGLSIVTLFAYSNLASWWRRVAFVVLGIATVMVFNWIRVATVIYIGFTTRMESSLVHSHATFGWLLFAVALVPLFAIGYWITDAPDPGSRPRPAPREPARTPVLLLAGLLAVLTLGAGRAMSLWAGAGEPIAAPDLTLGEVAGWSGPRPLAEHTRWQPTFQGALAEAGATYLEGSRKAYLYLAYYGRERQGEELIGYANRHFDRKRWSRLTAGRVEALGGEHPLEANEEHLRSRTDSAELLIWDWYVVGSTASANPYLIKLLQLGEVLRRHPGGAAVMVATPVRGDIAEARSRLRRFVGGAEGSIRSLLAGRGWRR